MEALAFATEFCCCNCMSWIIDNQIFYSIVPWNTFNIEVAPLWHFDLVLLSYPIKDSLKVLSSFSMVLIVDQMTSTSLAELVLGW